MKHFFTLLLAIMLATCFISNAIAQDDTKKRGYEEYGIVAEQGGILIGQGSLIVEPALQYTHIESQRLDITGFTILPSLVVGLLQVQKVRRDILTPSMTFKYGILDPLEFDLKVPYSFRKDSYNIGSGENTVNKDVSDSGIGDIEGTLLWQLASEKGARPDIIANVRVKSDTGKDPFEVATETIQGIPVPEDELPNGSGFWAVEPSFTFVKTTDPAVLFMNLGYFWHIKRNIDNVGDVDPSDSFNFSVGSSIALNDKFIISTAYEQKWFTEASINSVNQEDTDVNIGSISFGGSYVLNDRSSFNISVSIGMTPDSPDTQLSLRYSIRVF
jgi:hypothetical protein